MSFSENHNNRPRKKSIPGSMRERNESPCPLQDWTNYEADTYKYEIQMSEDRKNLQYIKTPKKMSHEPAKDLIKSKRKSTIFEGNGTPKISSEEKNRENLLLNSQKLVVDTGISSDSIFSFTSLRQFDEKMEKAMMERRELILMLTIYLFYEFQKKGSKYFQVLFNNFLEKLATIKDCIICFQLILKCNEISLFNFKMLTELVSEMNQIRYLNLILEGNSLRKEAFRHLCKKLKNLVNMTEVKVTIREMELLIDKMDEVDMLKEFISLTDKVESNFTELKFEGIYLQYKRCDKKYELRITLLPENRLLNAHEYCEKLVKSLERFTKPSKEDSSKKSSFMSVFKSKKVTVTNTESKFEKIKFRRLLIRIENRDLGAKNMEKIINAVTKISQSIDEFLFFIPGNKATDCCLLALSELLKNVPISSLALNLNENLLSPVSVEVLINALAFNLATKKLTLSFSGNKFIKSLDNNRFLPMLKLSKDKLVYLFILFSDNGSVPNLFSYNLFVSMLAFRNLTFFQSNFCVENDSKEPILNCVTGLSIIEFNARRRLALNHIICALRALHRKRAVSKRILNEILELYI